MINKSFLSAKMTILLVIISYCVFFVSCDPDKLSEDDIIQNLIGHKWTGQSTEYDVYSYGAASYKQIWTIYFTSDHEGIMHWKSEEYDSYLGKTRNEDHIDFFYSVDGTKINLYGGSNFSFEYFDDYIMEGDIKYMRSELMSSDYAYISDHNKGYHGTDGRIDAEVYIIKDSEILRDVVAEENGWYIYVLQFGFGATNDEAYKKGMTQIKLTTWADNGCMDASYKTSNYGKKKTYTLFLSPTNKDWYDWIYVRSKDNKIIFNYMLEYYNTTNGQWYNITTKQLVFNR